MATLIQDATKYVKSKFGQLNTHRNNELNDEHDRITHFRKLYDYYTFNREAIFDHVSTAMKGTFKPETKARMQFPFYNLTKKVIDRLAVAYLLPAERYVIDSDRDNALYQEILTGSNINQVAKEWNRQGKLLDTVHVGVMFRNGRVEYDLFQPHALTVEEDENNYLKPAKISYDQNFGGNVYSIIWTEDEYKVLDEHGEMVPGHNPWNGKNLYGRIPIIPCRLRIMDDYWGEGDTELVYMNEKLNILVASMFHNLIMQSHGQAVAVNMNLPEEFSIGPDYTIEANDVQTDDVKPEYYYVHPDPATDANIRAADWIIKTAGVMKGLSAQSMNTEISDRQSGIAKGIDLAELRERRQDDIEFLRPFEKELFDVTRTVWNVNNPTRKLSERVTVGIDFVEPELPMTQAEEVVIKEFKKRYHLWTPVDDFIDEDEGVDKDKAIEQLLENKRINELLGLDNDGGSQRQAGRAKRKPFDQVKMAPGPREPLRDGIPLSNIRVGYGGSTNSDIRLNPDCECAEPLPNESTTRYVPGEGGKTLRFHPCRRCGGRIPIEQSV